MAFFAFVVSELIEPGAVNLRSAPRPFALFLGSFCLELEIIALR